VEKAVAIPDEDFEPIAAARAEHQRVATEVSNPMTAFTRSGRRSKPQRMSASSAASQMRAL
jgi:hypothetical protein